MMKNIVWMVVISGFLFSCVTPKPLPAATLPLAPTLTPTPAPTSTRTNSPTPTPYIPEPGWSQVRAGLEQRERDVFFENQAVDHLFMLRIDPNLYRFEIAYDADRPKSIEDWQRQTGALLVFNAGYFHVEKTSYLPVGLLVLAGQALGESYSGFGGMFAVTPHAVELRSLVQRPYRPGEPLIYALQSFPLLVKPGGRLGFPAEDEDHMIARRTVLAQDRKGRFVVLVTAYSYFTLHRLSLYLVNSDLNLDIALNLDGGPSSGIVLAEPYSSVPATSLLPIVVTVFPC